ncbi:DUF2589 domain-containing protein [Salinarchaeum sp. IM2453]|uniref:DUF2589 domain-containing protein n=1 Tax=Salinarchaeum sp. IM2453 TaxID=2862870 RepID=UPI001C835343|nr:DUF2589 domain-containing protein [Salinarchaeum sp. IM2453]QZA87735.1 DUF2589 domain-containing protein [Salinarchaeum sp. IM2453]
MANPDFPSELGNIPYDEILGAPLNAAVEANAAASETAANFILDVAFEEPDDFAFDATRKPVYVEFSYRKGTVNEQGESTEEEFELQVPLLLLLHVPYFEVDTVEIDFNVKLNSVEKKAESQERKFGGRAGYLPYFTVSGSSKKQEKRQQEIERKYHQKVHIEAGSIEPPEGTSRVMDVLEQTITEKPLDEAEE